MSNEITVALAGNPNSGKTALFNVLTGSRQRVGNWPGVTVDRKSGFYQIDQQTIQVVDLPGTYSTSVTQESSIDETIACEYLLSKEADVLINVLDGANLERNLYLTLQLLEMKIPMILAVNMMDIVASRGLQLDLKQLAKLTGCVVVPIIASQGKGIKELKTKILEVATTSTIANFNLCLPKILQDSIHSLAQSIQHPTISATWLAQRLLENDCYVIKQVEIKIQNQAVIQMRHIESVLGEEPDILIADARYTLANQIADQITKIIKTQRQNVTELLDKVVLNRFLGIPIFLGVMYLMFLFAINIGGAFQDFFDIASSTIFVNGFAHVLQLWHSPIWLTALLSNGLGKGINTVVTFAPIIGSMFLFLALLEDCGYMARAAFVMDRFMQALGLPGKSFVPMIVGFGCNVPAVMGARTLSNPRDRILTIMMMPFMSCGARLAIFSVFATAFFPHGGAEVIFLLYLLGILIAILSGLVLRKTMLPGKPAALIMELPPYHVPHMGSLIRSAWHRLKNFVVRAGKYIIPICVLIGVLNSVSINGRLAEEGSQHSLLASVGRLVTPVFAPMGINQNNWPATVGLATGILAKEVVVGTLNSLYNNMAAVRTQQTTFNFWGGLKDAVKSIPENLANLGSAFKNPIVANEPPHDMSKSAYGVMYERFDGKVGAFAYLLFVLLYFPCISTMAAIRRELNGRWAYFSMFWSTGMAYALAVICYQLLTVFSHPISSLIWSGSMILALLIAVIALRIAAKDTKANRGSGGAFTNITVSSASRS